jgi:hypothetical protein
MIVRGRRHSDSVIVVHWTSPLPDTNWCTSAGATLALGQGPLLEGTVDLHIRHNKFSSMETDSGTPKHFPPYADMFCLTWDRAAMTLADMNHTWLARGMVFICEFEARPHLGLNSVGARPRHYDRRGALSRGPTTLTGSDCSLMQAHPCTSRTLVWDTSSPRTRVVSHTTAASSPLTWHSRDCSYTDARLYPDMWYYGYFGVA